MQNMMMITMIEMVMKKMMTMMGAQWWIWITVNNSESIFSIPYTLFKFKEFSFGEISTHTITLDNSHNIEMEGRPFLNQRPSKKSRFSFASANQKHLVGAGHNQLENLCNWKRAPGLVGLGYLSVNNKPEMIGQRTLMFIYVLLICKVYQFAYANVNLKILH